MEKIDQIYAKVLAQEVMLSALAATASDKQKLMQSFNAGEDLVLSVILANDVNEPFVSEVQAQLSKLRELIS